MTGRYEFDVIVVGGNANGLSLAASLVASGKRTLLLEQTMKVGGELLTESFLTSHRYNLSGGWMLGETLARPNLESSNDAHRLLLPEIPFAAIFKERDPVILFRDIGNVYRQILRSDVPRLRRLHQFGQRLYTAVNARFSSRSVSADDHTAARLSGMTVRELLDDIGFRDQRLRCALTYLPLALGWDIRERGSSAALAYLLYGIGRSSLIDGGSGLLANSLADRIAAGGGMIVESARIERLAAGEGSNRLIELRDGRAFTAPLVVLAQQVKERAGPRGSQQSMDDGARPFGVYRSYLDFSRQPTGFDAAGGGAAELARSYMVGFGFEEEADVYRYLDCAGAGQPPFLAGHVLSNSFLDTANPVGALGLQAGSLWCTACHTTDTQVLTARARDMQRGQAGMPMTAGMVNERDLDGAGDGSSGRGGAIRPAPGSLIVQGTLPMQNRMLDADAFRKAFERAMLEKICEILTGIEPGDLRFQLTWLANEVDEPLLRHDLAQLAARGMADADYATEVPGVYRDPYAALSRYTGMRSAERLRTAIKATLMAS